MSQIKLSTGRPINERSSAYHALNYLLSEGEFKAFWSYIVTIISIAYQSMLQDFYGTAEDDEITEPTTHTDTEDSKSTNFHFDSVSSNPSDTGTATMKTSTPSSSGVSTPTILNLDGKAQRHNTSDESHEVLVASADGLRTSPTTQSWIKSSRSAAYKPLNSPRHYKKTVEISEIDERNKSTPLIEGSHGDLQLAFGQSTLNPFGQCHSQDLLLP